MGMYRTSRPMIADAVQCNGSFVGVSWGFRGGFVDRRSWHFHESGFPVTSLLPPVSPTHLQRADGIHKLPSELLTYIYVCRRPARGLCEARTHIKAIRQQAKPLADIVFRLWGDWLGLWPQMFHTI